MTTPLAEAEEQTTASHTGSGRAPSPAAALSAEQQEREAGRPHLRPARDGPAAPAAGPRRGQHRAGSRTRGPRKPPRAARTRYVIGTRLRSVWRFGGPSWHSQSHPYADGREDRILAPKAVTLRAMKTMNPATVSYAGAVTSATVPARFRTHRTAAVAPGRTAEPETAGQRGDLMRCSPRASGAELWPIRGCEPSGLTYARSCENGNPTDSSEERTVYPMLVLI